MVVFGILVGKKNLTQMTGRLMVWTWSWHPSLMRAVWRVRSSEFMIMVLALSFQRMVLAVLTPLMPSRVGEKEEGVGGRFRFLCFFVGVDDEGVEIDVIVVGVGAIDVFVIGINVRREKDGC